MSPVTDVIARRYLASRAGRTGAGRQDLIFPFNDLLRDAESLQGSARHEAIGQLERLEKEELLVIERHARDRSAILKVRLPVGKGEAFIERIGRQGPESQRRGFAEMMGAEYAQAAVPEEYREDWLRYCRQTAEAAARGVSIAPLDSANVDASRELLDVSVKLLNWKGESYLRFASCVVCGDSKRLGNLKSGIDRLLEQITQGRVRSLGDLGITETGGGCWLHGPGTLITQRGQVDLGALNLPGHFSKSDLAAGRIESDAQRWITVENETMLLELAKLHSGVMLMSSGFRGGVANSAVVGLLQSAPDSAELWHFGDSDPKGFDILRDLRERTGRRIRSLHMVFRPAGDSPALSAEDRRIIQRLMVSEAMTVEEKAEIGVMLEAGVKGLYEQESLGRPGAAWMFYQV
ncbi:MAG: Wadjet anti-phage system protein JetD domain-containing protein [Chthoniobacteraceae bacterium]